MLAWPYKDPEEVLDYQVDWSDRLGADDIVASTWTIPVGGAALTINSNSFTVTHTLIWLAAGTLGITYQLTNHITTLGGRQMEQTIKLKIKAK